MQEITKYPFLHTFNSVQKINATNVKERLSRKPHQLFKPHRIDFYMICIFTSGTGQHMVDFNTLDVSEGHMLLVSPGQIHSFDPRESYDGNTVVFTADFFSISDSHRNYLKQSQLFNDVLKVSYFDVSSNLNELNDLYKAIIKELKKPVDQYQRDILSNYLYNMLLLAERLYVPEQENKNLSREAQLIWSFKSLAETKLIEHWTIQQYADHLNVSPRTLQNVFRKLSGQSPKDWLKERIILEIKRNLIYDSTTVSEISYQLGFKDISYFVRFFKNSTGYTPAEFREAKVP